MELRMQDVEIRANGDGTMTVSGYVNETGKLSAVLGGSKKFKEQIQKGAFKRAIQRAKHDIDFLAEHDRDKILASTGNQSLELKEDQKGLYMSATIANTSWGRDYYELINSKMLKSMSFGFQMVKEKWRTLTTGMLERTITELELFEVSVVRFPAYPQSNIAARGVELVRAEDVDIPNTESEETNMNQEELLEALSKKMDVIAESQVTIIDELVAIKEAVGKEEPAQEPEEEPAQEPEEDRAVDETTQKLLDKVKGLKQE